MTSIEWFIEKIGIIDIKDHYYKELYEQAKEMHKQEIIDAYNKSFELRHKPYSTADKYYQETFVSKESDECYFEPTTNTSSATICKHCGREKFLHTT